jgi:hypothetical protein
VPDRYARGNAWCSPDLIGVPGFEPGTSPTRTARATRLRHTPKQAKVSGYTAVERGFAALYSARK